MCPPGQVTVTYKLIYNLLTRRTWILYQITGWVVFMVWTGPRLFGLNIQVYTWSEFASLIESHKSTRSVLVVGFNSYNIYVRFYGAMTYDNIYNFRNLVNWVGFFVCIFIFLFFLVTHLTFFTYSITVQFVIFILYIY